MFVVKLSYCMLFSSSSSFESKWEKKKMEIQENTEKGRFYVATKHFDVGDVVLKCEPLADTLTDPTRYCSNCYASLKSVPKPFVCQHFCKSFAYCSNECRSAHWAEVHSKECSSIALFGDPYAQSIAAFFIRIINSGDKWTFLRPSPMFDPSNYEIPSGYASIYETLVKKEEEEEEEAISIMPPDKLKMMFACVYNNSFTVEGCAPEREKVGIAVYLEASLFSHSCVCNTARSFRGKTVCFRASRPIEPGEEITIAYSSKLDEPLSVRRAPLQSHFGFLCRCERCVSEEADGKDERMTVLCKQALEPFESKSDWRGALSKAESLLSKVCDDDDDEHYSKAFLYKRTVLFCEKLGDMKRVLQYKWLLAENSICKQIYCIYALQLYFKKSVCVF